MAYTNSRAAAPVAFRAMTLQDQRPLDFAEWRSMNMPTSTWQSEPERSFTGLIMRSHFDTV
jgi:hypothetical protein